ncbi:Interferon- developmental regulator 1 [Coemansia interrupta]|uniref:Interferon- developmental regulator 1 n=1 Tax=Coemansia interrupta TaxID=1126814 RepID=A0A9W8HNQ8_9FUNG|nr:Interferon- developmental regulator 1 [Coemansia interrupta]
MGQSASRTAARKAAANSSSMRLPRAPTQTPSPATRTREQMLTEDADAQATNGQLADNLRRFLNPRELRTPITPRDAGENANVQALRSRREDDDVEVAGRLTARHVADMLRQTGGKAEEAGVAQKYGVDADTLSVLARFLRPVEADDALMVGASNTSELLRAALNSGRTPSAGGRSSASRRGSRQGTPSRMRSRAGSREGSDDELDDAASTASDDTWVETADDDAAGHRAAEAGDNWEAIFDEAMDSLGEKRAATREKALATIVRVMSLRYLGDELAGSRIALLEALKRSARSTKSEKESMLALLALALWFVNFGMDEGDEYAGAEAVLRALVGDHKAAGVRAVALSVLGMANFVAAVDFNDAADAMRFVSERFFAAGAAAAPAALLRQALETYGLLLTVLIDGNAPLAERTFAGAFDAHMRALAADAVDVRVAAAQNFALMHEALGDDFERQDELVATLQALRQESAKRHGKRDTHAQRAAMRDVLRSLEDGRAPEMRLVLAGRSVAFGRWQRIVRLHSFRACLGGGLPVHFAENPLLQDVFDVRFDRGADGAVADAARVVVSPKSELAKMRSKDMRKKRSAHAAQQAALDLD